MSYPVIDIDECIGCGICVDSCPADVLELEDDRATVVDGEACIGCAACMDACPADAITEIAED